MKRPIWLALLLLSLTLAAVACTARPAANPSPPRVVLALIDVSGSTGAVRARYLDQVRRIVASVPAGARLVVLPISSRSLTAPAAVDITFPAYTWWKTNAFTHRRAMTRLRQQAGEAAAALFGPHPDTRGTALVDSLLQAQEFLKSYPEGTGALYVISDMVEQSGLVDLYSLDDAGVEPALAKVAEAGRLPALRGAAVTVAGLEASGHLPSDRVLAIKSFWEQLFQAAGARLVGYSPTLPLADGAP